MSRGDVLRQPFALETYREQRLRMLMQNAERLVRQRMCRVLLSNVEPDVFLERWLLRQRRDCYLVTRDSRLTVAQQELDASESRRMRGHDW